MSNQSPRIHPTAHIDPTAELDPTVSVGPFAVIEGNVRIGPDCIIRPHAMLTGDVTLGRGNVIFPGAILGERPQHLKFNEDDTRLEIGDYNIFREHVTIHRGTTASYVTKIGSHNFFMANSHVAHDCVVNDHCILANGSLLAGHCHLADNVYLSGNSAVHQFVRIGRLAMLSGCSATSKDIPPFVIQQGFDNVVGVNVVGMRRAGLERREIDAVRRSFRLLFREGLSASVAVARMKHEFGELEVVEEIITFLQSSQRGINVWRGRPHAA